MEYRKFGKLDFKPSALGFGMMRLPTIGGDTTKIDEKKAREMVYYAIEHGVNYIDTAYPYHGGQSEPFAGKILQGKWRKKVKLATKLPTWLIEKEKDFNRFLNEQLKRLKTDYIDFYLFHSLDEKKWEKILKFNGLSWAEKIKKKGLIGHIGFSFHDKFEVFKKIIDNYPKWEFCQIQYNFLDVDFQAGRKGLKYSASKGLGVVVMEPLKGGKLAQPPEEIKKIWNSFSPKRTPVEWAFAWLLNQEEVSLVLSGMSTLSQVKENVKSASFLKPNFLKKEELELIAKVRKKYEILAPVDCTKCEYCLPCPQGVNIPKVFELYNNAKIFNDKKAKKKYQELEDREKPKNCVKCGRCETACPQKIKIINWLEKIEDFFEKS